MFLSRCVPSIYRELVLSHTQLETCLTFLTAYCVNKNDSCDERLEHMMSAKYYGGTQGDMNLVNCYCINILRILKRNPSYHINFSTAKHLILKFSSIKSTKNPANSQPGGYQKEEKGFLQHRQLLDYFSKNTQHGKRQS